MLIALICAVTVLSATAMIISHRERMEKLKVVAVEQATREYVDAKLSALHSDVANLKAKLNLQQFE